MSSLTLLPASTVHRIASSQVITSVSTAIKELVENSLDAGADNVEVKLEEHGLSKIEVRDNGCGIKREDAQVMAQRYYTSKINCFENLSELTTYGFRGEALSSLCAVSNVSITTKTKDNAVAICYTLGQSGKVFSTKPVPSATGTTVVVTNLFKNLPVRKQFLSSKKKCKEELKKIEELIMSFGCIHPEVRLVLWHNKSIFWQKGKANDYKTSLVMVLGSPVVAQMDKVEYENQEYNFKLTGYLPKMESDPSLTCRASNDRCFVFVNDRPVLVKEVSQLVKELYSPAGNRYPIIFLSIKLPPNEVDVNLEPNKTRVLLTEKERILDAIKAMLEKFYKKEIQMPKVVSNSNSEDGEMSKTVEKAMDKKSNTVNIIEEKRLTENGQVCTPNLNNNINLTSKDEHLIDDFNMDETFNPMASSTQNNDSTKNGNQDLYNLPANNLETPEDSSCSQIEKDSANFELKHDDLELSLLAEGDSVAVLSNSFSLAHNSDNHKVDGTEGVVGSGDGKNEKSCAVMSLTSTGIPFSLNAVQDCDETKSSKSESSNAPTNFGTEEASNHTDAMETTALNKSSQSSSPSLGKEDVDNIYRLLDLSEKETQSLCSKENTLEFLVSSTHQCQEQIPQKKDVSQKNSISFDLENVFNDLEFDEILKDVADKKGCSQSTLPIPSSDTSVQSTASKVKDMFDLNNKDACEKGICGKDWSRGNILKDKQKNLLEPTKLLTPLSVRPVDKNKPSAVPGKRKHSGDKSLSLKRNKKLKQVNQVNNQSLITVHTSQTPQQRYQDAKKVTVPFSMSNLKSYDPRPRRNGSSSSKHHLIGRLEPSGVWLMLKGDEIVFVNQYRIQEQILFHKLMQTHSLTGEKLEKSIHLEPRLVGGEECWTILTNLESENQCLDSTRLITDERIKSNGFDIRIKLDPNTDDQKIEVIGITTSLPFYGIPDLAEILGLIRDSDAKESSLSECRPLKVINYLKGEAVRVCRGLSTRMGREDIERTLTQIDEYLPKHVTNCLHHKPFTGHVASIPNLS